MKREVRCPVCGEVLGYIEFVHSDKKIPQVSDTDEKVGFPFETTLYCPGGHLLGLKITSPRPPVFVLAT